MELSKDMPLDLKLGLKLNVPSLVELLNAEFDAAVFVWEGTEEGS
jgi:hypothetical protein